LQLGRSTIGFAGDLALPGCLRLGPLSPASRAGQLATQLAQVAFQPLPPSGGGGVGGLGLLELVGQLGGALPLPGQRAVRVAHDGQVGINQHADLGQFRQRRIRGDAEQVGVRRLRRHPPAAIERPPQGLHGRRTGRGAADE
jgi:hypothetical protein